MLILSLRWMHQRERRRASGLVLITLVWYTVLCLYGLTSGQIWQFGAGELSASAPIILIALTGSGIIGILLGVSEAEDIDLHPKVWVAQARQHLPQMSLSLLTFETNKLTTDLLVGVKRVTDQHEKINLPPLLTPFLTPAGRLFDSEDLLPHLVGGDHTDSTIKDSLRLLTIAVWNNYGSGGDCPPDKYPEFRQLDDLIFTTAWGTEARDEFFSRWSIVEKISNRTFDGVGSFAQLAYLTWEEAQKTSSDVKHPLAPLIWAWQSGPKEVQPVRDADGNLRSDTIAPRIAMCARGGKTDRLYLPPAHIERDATGKQIVLPGFGDGNRTGRVPVLPVELYDLGVKAGKSRGGRGAAPIPARMLVKLAAAPSTSVRHGERFVTYNITLRDIRDALYPPEFLDGRPRQQYSVGRVWPTIREAIRIINHEARIPLLDPKTGYGYYHNLLRINENFGRIDLDMPIGVVLDIPPQVEGGVQLPKRLDQWGAESAPAYRALIGLSFIWHEPGRTHAPVSGRWMRKKSLDVYDPLTDDDVVALAYPSSVTANRRMLVRRAWDALENLEEHGELRIDARRILPPTDTP